MRVAIYARMREAASSQGLCVGVPEVSPRRRRPPPFKARAGQKASSPVAFLGTVKSDSVSVNW